MPSVSITQYLWRFVVLPWSFSRLELTLSSISSTARPLHLLPVSSHPPEILVLPWNTLRSNSRGLVEGSSFSLRSLRRVVLGLTLLSFRSNPSSVELTLLLFHLGLSRLQLQDSKRKESLKILGDEAVEQGLTREEGVKTFWRFRVFYLVGPLSVLSCCSFLNSFSC